MKHLLILISAMALLSSCATRQQAHVYVQPSAVPVQRSIARAQSQVDQARGQTAELAATKLDQVQTSMVVALSRTLDGVRGELQTSQGEVVKLNAKVAEQTLKLNDTEQARANEHNARVEADDHVHKLKFLVCGSIAMLVLGIASFFAVKFWKAAVLIPYGAVALASGPPLLAGAVFAFLWWKL